ncbi:hypothetical protein KLP28_14760 [Nocardioidaceae bacterium]|nr:hypothetical protein KLP28_14760 [Nocardioidaceae bacterium]
MDRRLLVALFALPGLAMAGGAVLHPSPPNAFRPETAELWFQLHVVGILGFPLVGVALIALYHRHLLGPADPEGGWLARWAVRGVVGVTGYVYATFYTALDVLAGVGNGYVLMRKEDTGDREEIGLIFSIGDQLGYVGSWALMICVLVVAVDHLVRHRLRAVGGLLLLPGAYLVHTDHIFSPLGLVGMLLLGAGTASLAWAALFAPGRPTKVGQKSLDEGSSTPRSAS